MKRIPAVLLLVLLLASAACGQTQLRYKDLRDLRAAPQATPNMTLAVTSGNVYVGNTWVQYAGGNSPAFVAPVANNRIDELTLNEAGALEVTQGAAAASPSPPAHVAGKLPICYVYLKSTSTSIISYNDAVAAHGYIWADIRPFLWPMPQDLTTDGSPTFATVNLDANLIFSSAAFHLRANTSDGADNLWVRLAGGGEDTPDRGAVLHLGGNETTIPYGYLRGPSLLNPGVPGTTAPYDGMVVLSTGGDYRVAVDRGGNFVPLTDSALTLGSETGPLRWSDGSFDQVHLNSYAVTCEGTTVLGQDYSTDASPTFAGATLTGFSGYVKAVAGVLSASAIADADIPAALTGKTYNGLTLTALETGFSVAGGTTPKTLTVEDTSLIDQDLTSDTGPTFNHLHITYNVAAASLTLTGPLKFDTLAPAISAQTNDGSDNALFIIAGGGASGGLRGATISLAGNEYTANYQGIVTIGAGIPGTTGTYDGFVVLTTGGAYRIAVDRSGNLVPLTDSSFTLGTSAPLYWSNTYTDSLTLNATAVFGGANAGRIGVTGTIDAHSITANGVLGVDHIAETTGAHTVTFDNNITLSAKSIVTDTTTGLTIATGATQKVGFFGAAPVVRQAHLADPAATAAALATWAASINLSLERFGLNATS